MRITNNRNLPDALVRAVVEDNYSRGRSDTSVTQLIGSPRQAVLFKRHHEQVEVDVADRFWSLLGRGLHAILEDKAAGDETVATEQRIQTSIAGWVVSGQFDWLKWHGYDLSVKDYKLATAWQAMSEKKEWEEQLNILAWLLDVVANEPDEDGVLPDETYAVKDVSIVILIRDWSRSQADKDPDYPQSPILDLPQRLWPFDVRESFVKERVAAHQQARWSRHNGEELPDCTDEERWIRPQDWAAMKPGAKRASKVFQSEQEGREYVAQKEGLELVQRKSDPMKCRLYCSVAPFCSQWQSELAAMEAAE